MASRQSAPEQPIEVVEKIVEIVARAPMGGRGVARIAVARIAPRRRSSWRSCARRLRSTEPVTSNQRARWYCLAAFSVSGPTMPSAGPGLSPMARSRPCASRTSAVGICAAAALGSGAARCRQQAAVPRPQRSGRARPALRQRAAVPRVLEQRWSRSARCRRRARRTRCRRRHATPGDAAAGRSPDSQPACRSRSHRFRCLPPARRS